MVKFSNSITILLSKQKLTLNLLLIARIDRVKNYINAMIILYGYRN